MNVWTYWAGPMPEWITWCLRSIERCCRQSTFHLLTPDTVPALPLDDRWRQLPPGVGTDCLRAAILSELGGLWIDADTVCVDDPAKLLDTYDARQFVYPTWTKPPHRVVAGYVYAPAGNPIARQWLDNVNAALKYAESIGWGECGEKMLTPIVQMSPSPAASWRMNRAAFLPIDIDSDVERFFAPGDWQSVRKKDTLAFGLNNSWMMHNRAGDMTADGNLLINGLLRHAKQAG